MIVNESIWLHAELQQVEFGPLHDVSAFGRGDPLAISTAFGLVGEGLAEAAPTLQGEGAVG